MANLYYYVMIGMVFIVILRIEGLNHKNRGFRHGLF